MGVTRTRNSLVKRFQSAAIERNAVLFIHNYMLSSLKQKKCHQLVMQNLRKQTMIALLYMQKTVKRANNPTV